MNQYKVIFDHIAIARNISWTFLTAISSQKLILHGHFALLPESRCLFICGCKLNLYVSYAVSVYFWILYFILVRLTLSLLCNNSLCYSPTKHILFNAFTVSFTGIICSCLFTNCLLKHSVFSEFTVCFLPCTNKNVTELLLCNCNNEHTPNQQLLKTHTKTDFARAFFALVHPISAFWWYMHDQISSILMLLAVLMLLGNHRQPAVTQAYNFQSATNFTCLIRVLSWTHANAHYDYSNSTTCW